MLQSNRAGGTTGAVLWRASPLLADWLVDRRHNPLWWEGVGSHDGSRLLEDEGEGKGKGVADTDAEVDRPRTCTSSSTAGNAGDGQSPLLGPHAAVLELGCGTAGLLALALAPWVRAYVATDQDYVGELFWQNVRENAGKAKSASDDGDSTVSGTTLAARKNREKGKGGKKRGRDTGEKDRTSCRQQRYQRQQQRRQGTSTSKRPNITFLPLDWETDDPAAVLAAGGFGSLSSTTNPDQNPSPNPNPDPDTASTSTSTSATPTTPPPLAATGVDLILAADTVYNDALAAPFFRAVRAVAGLREGWRARCLAAAASGEPTTAEGELGGKDEAEETKEPPKQREQQKQYSHHYHHQPPKPIPNHQNPLPSSPSLLSLPPKTLALVAHQLAARAPDLPDTLVAAAAAHGLAVWRVRHGDNNNNNNGDADDDDDGDASAGAGGASGLGARQGVVVYGFVVEEAEEA